MKKKRILLALLALALAVSVSLPAAMAYFTTNARASGTRTLELGGRTTIEENMAGWSKEITISAEEPSQPMWVRARAYADVATRLTYDAGSNWVHNSTDGWWYFTLPLANPAGEGTVTQTSMLKVTIDPIKVSEVGVVPDGFEVPVVYETVPVSYNENGELLPYNAPGVWAAAGNS